MDSQNNQNIQEPQNTQEIPNPAVRNMQTYLRELSFYYPEIPAPPIDGIFEDNTRKSLSAFQRLSGLPVTGTADQETWEALYTAYRLTLAANSPPRHMGIFPLNPAGYQLQNGDSGFPVAAIQYMLRELEAMYGKIGPMEVTGQFDDMTTDAVKTFQRQNSIPPSGFVGRTTWNWLTDQYNQLFMGRPEI